MHARTRPRYGDTLRAQTQAIAMSGDATPEALVGPVFETLVTVDDNGHLQPALAAAWTMLNNGLRWEFTLRPGVVFNDGQLCDSPAIEASLSRVPGLPWKVHATSRGLVIESDTPQPNLPALLSLPRYAIYATTADDRPVGSGPFFIESRIGPTFLLKANDNYWGGRPYIDRLEITTSRNPRDQLNDFTLDRADIMEVGPDQWRRVQQDRLRTRSSRPSLGLFVVVESSKPELRDQRLCQAIALSIDRATIQNVILQRQGEVVASLLPNWLTGYAFLFDSRQDIARARQLRNEVGQVSMLTIAYDAGDPVQRLIAERIALNAHDAGINLQAVPKSTPGTDLRIRSVTISSLDAAAALNDMIDQLNLMPAASSPNAQSLYENERAALQSYAAVPLVFLPRTTALKDRVRNWGSSPVGDWKFGDIWLVPRSRPEVRP
ncbi:MAG: ABC transporter substrate-binding protein [Terriglobales bacterium]